MICNVCGSTESYTAGGSEYCKECNNEFTLSRNEELSDESFSSQSQLSSSKGKQKKKETREKIRSRAPWTSFEAYNFVLSKQVTALIKLGCSEQLRTVVLCIWAQYLQKLQIAFRTDYGKEENKPRLSTYALKRDLILLYNEGKPARKSEFSCKIKKKTATGSKKKRKQLTKLKAIKTEKAACFTKDGVESNEESIDSEVDNNCSRKDDIDPLPVVKVEHDRESTPSESSALAESNPTSSKKKTIKYSTCSRKSRSKIKRKDDYKGGNSSLHHLSLPKTLSFCHLGLLYTESQICLHDLIRFINEGRIPYLDVTRHFPATMQLQANDYNVFNKYVTPEIKSISQMSAKLWEFLKLPKFKHPPLLPAAIRFIKDLNLPNDLIAVVKVLIDKFEAKRGELYSTKDNGNKIKPIPPYEIQAMSFIVISLKMLLLLNGQFEIDHGDAMKKLNTIAKDGQFFIWKDWQEQAMLKEYLFLKNSNNFTGISRLDSLNADRIISNYLNPCLKPNLHEQINTGGKREHSARNEIKEIIESLMNHNSLNNKPTSFPLKYQVHRLMNEWENLRIYQEIKEIDFSLLSKDFSDQRLCYGLYLTSSKPKDMISLMLSSLYEYSKIKNEKKLKTIQKYWHVNLTLKDALPDKAEKWTDSLPASFKWLLKFLCKYLQISCLDLYMEIKSIEHKLFTIVK